MKNKKYDKWIKAKNSIIIRFNNRFALRHANASNCAFGSYALTNIENARAYNNIMFGSFILDEPQSL